MVWLEVDRHRSIIISESINTNLSFKIRINDIFANADSRRR
jgi:hypothetical protein